MEGKFEVEWTPESKIQIDLIVRYLREDWSEREVDDFLDLLFHFQKTIAQFPNAFKKSKTFRGCRAGFVHKNITAVYYILKEKIVVITVFDNRSNKYGN